VDIVRTLNPEQRAAVEHPGGPLLVVAGAGSGKTRVLTERVAWLLDHGVSPEAIVAFTFTNRAAREMRERIEKTAGEQATRLWVGTFHGTAVRLLRREADAAGVPRDFTIYDREDQEAVVRDLLKSLEVPESEAKLGAVLGRISDAKNALVTPDDFTATAVGPFQRRVAEVYAAYQAALRANGALDFDDLIAEAVRLLEQHPAGERWRRRFEHVLVDEYQDTNHAQFRFVSALASHHRELFVVGDDDQSIYGWRGAHLANVLDFEQAFPGARVLRLERNYRSTQTILRAANAVIENNRSRMGKTLWSDREDGPKLRFELAMDEVDEARRVRGVLDAHVRAGGKLADVAVLYRTNAQSRAIETELRHARVPYEIVGGVSFYQRREVKDVLAYLRLLVNPTDTVAFFRIWNTPRRGLGASAEGRVLAVMNDSGRTPLEALAMLLQAGELSRPAQAGARDLLDLLDEMREAQSLPVHEQVVKLLERTRYLEHLDSLPDAEDRRANVQELVIAAASFTSSGGGLAEFLAESALVADIDRIGESSDRTLLLTAHNAKGLEFPVVIVSGLEEGLFPHASALDQPSELEEERRLFYVALTRAKDAVVLTAAAYRRRYDAPRGGAVSRFVDEVPAELLDREDPAALLRRQDYDSTLERRRRHRAWQTYSGFDEDPSVVAVHPVSGPPVREGIGREVFHEQFGRGVVVGAERAGDDVKYSVRFRNGIKKVLGRFLSGGHDGDGA